MSDIVIKAENLGKMYTIGHQAENGRYVALRDVLMQNARTLWNKTKDLATGQPIIQGDTMEEVWALKDVNFEIRRGEVMGIIGRNGAGKSTLLKILSRITEPSTGRLTIKGRVASLLEVGTGFHPELSGRENIYLNGTILGMTRAEIKRKFDEIVAFAEVEKYLDTPVKRYSSGMYVRLAFAVAAYLEPEILVVDEVLAVGDISFQKKCMGKMGDIAREGRTILFVSHNLAAISNLCKMGMVLDQGFKVFDANVAGAVSFYTEMQAKNRAKRAETNYDALGEAEFISGSMLSQKGKIISSVLIDEPLIVEMVFKIGSDLKGIAVPNFHFITAEGLYAFCVNAPEMQKSEPGVYVARCHIPAHILNDGVYTIGLALTEYFTKGYKVHFFEQHYLTLNVVEQIHDNPSRYDYGGQVPGVIRPLLKWEVKQKERF